MGDVLCFAFLSPWLLPESEIPWGAGNAVEFLVFAVPIRFIYGISYGLIPGFVFYLNVNLANNHNPVVRFPYKAYLLCGLFAATARYAFWPDGWILWNLGLPAIMALFITTVCRPPFLKRKSKP